MPGIDIPTALQHHDHQPALFVELLGEFVRLYGEAPHRLRTLIENEDQAAAERLAHNIYGLAGSFGAQRLRLAAGEMEQALQQPDQPTERLFLAFEDALAEVIRSAQSALDDQIPFRRERPATD